MVKRRVACGKVEKEKRKSDIKTWSRVQKRGVSNDCGSMSRYGRKKLVALASSNISSTWSSTFLFLDFLGLDFFYFSFFETRCVGVLPH